MIKEIYVFHDSEWESDIWISTTVLITEKIESKKFIYTYKTLKLLTFVNKHITNIKHKRVKHLYSPKKILEIIYPYLSQTKAKITLINFFSPKDIYYLIMTSDNIEQLNLTQKTYIKGNFYYQNTKFKIQDFNAIFGKQSLKNKLKLFNLNTHDKELADNYKTQMIYFIKNHPKEFIKYAEADVKILPRLRNQAQKILNTYCQQLQIKLFQLPLSIGTMVAQIILKLYKQSTNQENLIQILTKNSLKHGLKHDPYNPIYHAVGGRCNNEQPDVAYCHHAVDIDIVSCYSNILKSLKIPFSEFKIITETTTIREFLENHDIFEDYWVILFDATFDFDQQIFPTSVRNSKGIFTTNIYFKYQVKNGILTQPLLETAKKFWSEQAYEYLLSIKPLQIIYYDKKTTHTYYNLKVIVDHFEKIKQSTNTVNRETAKLIINTIYGIFCSQYFIVGSILLAHYITAKARAQVFHLVKKYNLFQSITDGGLADINNPADETIELDFEIKYKAIDVKAFFTNKADYIYNNEAKLRGIQGHDNIKYEFFCKALNNEPFNLDSRLFIYRKIYTIEAWKHENTTKGFELSKHRPIGSDKIIYRIFTLKANHIKFNDLQDYQTYDKIVKRKTSRYEYFYEQYLDYLSMPEIIKLMNERVFPTIVKQYRHPINTKKIFLTYKQREPIILNQIFLETPDYKIEIDDNSNIGYAEEGFPKLFTNPTLKFYRIYTTATLMKKLKPHIQENTLVYFPTITINHLTCHEKTIIQIIQAEFYNQTLQTIKLIAGLDIIFLSKKFSSRLIHRIDAIMTKLINHYGQDFKIRYYYRDTEKEYNYHYQTQKTLNLHSSTQTNHNF